jgi:hypothetical protein
VRVDMMISMSQSSMIALAGVLIALATFVYARRQIVEARRATALGALMPFFESWHSEECKRTRGRLYTGDLIPGDLSVDDEARLRLVLDRLELLGALVENRIVDFPVVQSMFWHSPVKVWKPAKPFIDAQRAAGQERYAHNYELLVGRYAAVAR